MTSVDRWPVNLQHVMLEKIAFSNLKQKEKQKQ